MLWSLWRQTDAQLSLEPRSARGLELHVPEAARSAVGSDETRGLFTGALFASLRDPATDRDGDGTIQISELSRSSRVA